MALAVLAILLAGKAFFMGPNAPSLAFRGKIVDKGRLTEAYLGIDVRCKKDDGRFVPVNLIEARTLPNFEFHLGLNLSSPLIGNTAGLRAYALDNTAKRGLVQLELKDNKTLYEKDIDLSADANFKDYGELEAVPKVILKGKIKENGKAVPAHLVLDVFSESSEKEEVPISLLQLKSPSDYYLVINDLLFHNKNIKQNIVLRAQSLSIDGGSALVNIDLSQNKTEYVADLDLSIQKQQTLSPVKGG